MSSASAVGHLFSEVYPAVTASIGSARKAVVSKLAALGVSERLVDTAALVVSELSANAVEASEEGTFTVAVNVERGPAVVCVVRNPASVEDLPDRADWGPTEPLAHRGRGLGIVDAVADAVSTSQDGAELVVTARLK